MTNLKETNRDGLAKHYFSIPRSERLSSNARVVLRKHRNHLVAPSDGMYYWNENKFGRKLRIVQ